MREFLNSLATGYNKSAQSGENSRVLWTQVSEALNSHGDEAYKDWKGWSAFWVDYKGKLERKVSAANKLRTGTGGGPSTAPIINDIDRKFLSILGEDYAAGLTGIQVNSNLEDANDEPPLPQLTT